MTPSHDADAIAKTARVLAGMKRDAAKKSTQPKVAHEFSALKYNPAASPLELWQLPVLPLAFTCEEGEPREHQWLFTDAVRR